MYNNKLSLTKKTYRHLLLDVCPLEYFTELLERDHVVAVLVSFNNRPLHNTIELFFTGIQIYLLFFLNINNHVVFSYILLPFYFDVRFLVFPNF